MKRASSFAAVAAVALLAVGCDNSRSPTMAAAPNFDFTDKPWNGTLPASGDGVTSPELFQVCKVGSDATFNYYVSSTPSNVASINVKDGECWIIALFGGTGETVNITESAAPAGYGFNRVVVETEQGISPQSFSSVTSTNPSVSGLVRGGGALAQGVTATYFNQPIETSGQGCTPGYWKQPQHFDSYPAPYAPTTLFSDVFDNAFPGMTLLQVMQNGGGGLNALGRHTVAALLNAGNPGVTFTLTPAQVIAQFNALYPTATGSNSSYNGLKNVFEGFNTQGCPLN